MIVALLKRGGPSGGTFFMYFRFLLEFCVFLFVETMFFLSFSTQSHAESFRNFVENSVLVPKCVKLDQKSPCGVSGGQGFLPKIPPAFTEHLN